jgi:hypothetical protein
VCVCGTFLILFGSEFHPQQQTTTTTTTTYLHSVCFGVFLTDSSQEAVVLSFDKKSWNKPPREVGHEAGLGHQAGFAVHPNGRISYPNSSLAARA